MAILSVLCFSGFVVFSELMSLGICGLVACLGSGAWVETRALHMVGKHSNLEAYSRP